MTLNITDPVMRMNVIIFECVTPRGRRDVTWIHASADLSTIGMLSPVLRCGCSEFTLRIHGQI